MYSIYGFIFLANLVFSWKITPLPSIFTKVKNINFRHIRENSLYSKYIPNQKYINYEDINYNITTDFFVPNSIETAKFQKVRMSHFRALPDTELLSIIWFPKSYNYPILSIDLAQFAPNKMICHIYFYFFAPNDYIQKRIAVEKKIWEFPTPPSAHLTKFLMSLINSLPANRKSAAEGGGDGDGENSLFFSMKDPTQISHVYYAIKEILYMYMENAPIVDPSCFSTPSVEFNYMRAKLERNFIYKKYMSTDEIKELMELFSITP